MPLIALAMLNPGGHRPGPPPAGPDPRSSQNSQNLYRRSPISVIPDTKFGFFLDATHPRIAVRLTHSQQLDPKRTGPTLNRMDNLDPSALDVMAQRPPPCRQAALA
jgi:hypothetical protein